MKHIFYALLFFYVSGTVLQASVRSYVTESELEQFKAACEEGDMGGCYRTGLFYWEESRMLEASVLQKKSEELAKSFFELSCESGEYHACARLAFLESMPPRKQYKKAIRYANEACMHHIGSGCHFLAFAYRKGMGVKASTKKWKYYFSKAFKQLKKECKNINEEKKYSYDIAVDGAVSCGFVASYFEGIGNWPVKKDSVTAQHYYRKACDLGSYRMCQKVVTDLHDQEEMFLKGCAEGDAEACDRYVKILDQNAPPEDTAKAVKSCLQKDDVLGCVTAASAYLGTPKEILFMKRACKLKNADSCTYVGISYLHENPPKRQKARYYYDLGCRYGDSFACKQLKKFKK